MITIKQPRNTTLHNLRGIACLLVVYAHLITVAIYDKVGPKLYIGQDFQTPIIGQHALYFFNK